MIRPLGAVVLLASCGRGTGGDETGDRCDGSVPDDRDCDAWTAEAGDCDDADADVHPDAIELEDDVDQNCDGSLVVRSAFVQSVGTMILQGDDRDLLAGASVAFLPDVTGDSMPDVMVGAPGMQNGLHGVGFSRAFILESPFDGDGTTADAYAEIVSEEHGDAAGAVVGSLGDLDGDGYVELVYGAPVGIDNVDGDLYVFASPLEGLVSTDDAEVHVAGEDFLNPGYSVCSSSSMGWAFTAYLDERLHVIVHDGLPSPDDVTAGAVAVLRSEEAQSNSSLACGDVDGDGVTDLALGAPQHGDDDNNVGAVYILPGPLSGDLVMSDVGELFVGSDAYVHQHVGEAIAIPGDVDDDGRGDVVVGAFFRSLDYQADGGAFILSGDVAVSSGGTIEDEAMLVIESENPWDCLGDSVFGLGDVDGNGVVDVGLLASRSFTDQPPSPRVYAMLSPPPTGVVSAGSLDGVWVGTTDGVAAGVPYQVTEPVVGGGDTDLDGEVELLLGAPRADTFQLRNAGAVYLIEGLSF